MDDLKELVPRNKFDVERVHAVITLGYPAIEPILPELMEWLQDLNWPVARVLAPFIATIGSPLIPYIHHVMQTDDEVWKYWMVDIFMKESCEIAAAFRDELERIAYSPTKSEVIEELNNKAHETLKQHGWHKSV